MAIVITCDKCHGPFQNQDMRIRVTVTTQVLTGDPRSIGTKEEKFTHLLDRRFLANLERTVDLCIYCAGILGVSIKDSLEEDRSLSGDNPLSEPPPQNEEPLMTYQHHVPSATDLSDESS